MAKIKFGMMMTDARGKLGGQVFSKNRSGAYVRTKVTPVNPRTVAQMVSRSILGILSAGWSGLTDAQRASFNNAVEEWQKTDIFGDLKKPTGKNLYTSLNKNLLQSDQSQILVAPEKRTFPEVGNVSIVYSVATSSFSVSNIVDIDNGLYQVSGTPPLTQGTTFVKNRLRVLGYAASDSLIETMLSTAYVARFGDLAAGDNVYFQIKPIGDNGQSGVPVVVKISVVA